MMKHSLKDWVIATRPWSFPASSMPIVVSFTWLYYSDFKVNVWIGLLSLLTIVFVHAAGNTWSDYFDFKKKVDRKESYGVRSLTSGQFQPQEIFWYSVILQTIALGLGILLVCLTGINTLYIGLAGLALSLLYPPLKYIALGDVVIVLCYAVLPMIGMSYILTNEIHWEILWVAPPIALITDAILHSNNTRDVKRDKVANIKTFAMLIGPRLSSYLYVFEMIFPYLWIVGVACFSVYLPVRTIWLLLLSLPIAIANIRQILRFLKDKNNDTIANLDEKTAPLQLVFSLLLSVSMLIDKWVF